MALSEDAVLRLLVSAGGQATKADVVAHFREALDSDDPEEKRRNRALFKTLVNDVAVVKEIEGLRFVVLKKKLRHLVETGGDSGEEPPPPPPDSPGPAEPDPQANMSPVERALLRSTGDLKVKRMLSFELQKGATKTPRKRVTFSEDELTCKPHGLPLRTPPALTRVVESPQEEIRKPQMEETKVSSTVPLDHLEHKWLVTCAAGQWNQVLGLLLTDQQLAEKRDFISGFTALHWVAKCGNSQMLVKIMDLSKEGSVDVNAKAHGGYTPLHIAALHDQMYVLTMLVLEYGADVSIRDNCGKRAHHYLHRGAMQSVREMLGGPALRRPQTQVLPQEKEELDLLPDLAKGFQSISRLFQPHTPGNRKKHKQRPGFYSLSDQSEEPEEHGFRPRVGSDVFT
ncbi:ankyrin repeat domain-containing protein SOWAHA-like [Synchiropus splendidus]|uniref:ankyrin repeat domain-containing protein SOWAHA-like n=1 Tax=Synchiropus splendidus TaxID=270530 RepID=UPI00237EB185|nr:ankyrin repeat domain-containing protein SOWAHA-like [Synchiropus splendidus]